jgi:hypothetical protein
MALAVVITVVVVIGVLAVLRRLLSAGTYGKDCPNMGACDGCDFREDC